MSVKIEDLRLRLVALNEEGINRVEYDSETREIVLEAPIENDEAAALKIERLTLRISEDLLYQLMDKLPAH